MERTPRHRPPSRPAHSSRRAGTRSRPVTAATRLRPRRRCIAGPGTRAATTGPGQSPLTRHQQSPRPRRPALRRRLRQRRPRLAAHRPPRRARASAAPARRRPPGPRRIKAPATDSARTRHAAYRSGASFRLLALTPSYRRKCVRIHCSAPSAKLVRRGATDGGNPDNRVAGCQLRMIQGNLGRCPPIMLAACCAVS